MKYAVISDGKLYIEDDRWVTIRGNHVLIKGSQEAEDIQTYINSVDPEELTLIDKNGNTTVIKRGKPMSFKEADGKKPNPLYDTNWKYTQNCQVCVAAFELRLRGYDVEAKAFDLGNKAIRALERDPNEMFMSQREMLPIEKDFESWTLENQYKRLERKVKGKERYHLCIHWEDGSGHVVTLQRSGRQLMVYDPQNGETFKGVKEIRDNLLKDSETLFLYRVDDKPVNVELASKVLKKSGD